MNQSEEDRSDSEDAWIRHYVSADQRRRDTAFRRKGKPPLHLLYRRREIRIAYTIAVVVAGLLLAAWVSV